MQLVDFLYDEFVCPQLKLLTGKFLNSLKLK